MPEKNVLFVDDEPEFLEQAKVFLEENNSGLAVETAISAKEGLKMLEEENFDAVVSDYEMPILDGLEFLKMLREEKGFDIPFIVFTCKDWEEIGDRIVNFGSCRYLKKAGDPKSTYDLLHKTIKKITNRSKTVSLKKKRYKIKISYEGKESGSKRSSVEETENPLPKITEEN